jgi:cell division protein FtsB
MRWKLMRRRLSISAPRMIVRSHLPWPLRWAAVAVTLGFSAAIALWAFEFGKDIAGVDRNAGAEIARLRQELAQLKAERERTASIANTADSLLKTEKAAQERLTQQLKQLETENMALKADLGFFERLLPAGANAGVTIRSLHAEAREPGHMRFQLLVMQPGKSPPEFRGRYEVTLAGTLDGKPWSYTPPESTKPLQMKQYLRVEGMVDHPREAIVKTVQVKVLDTSGGVKATQTAKV